MLIQPLTPEILEKRRRFRRKILSLPGRFWRKTWRGILWTLAIAFVAHSALNIYASALLNHELAAIRQKGEPLQFSELAPPPVPDSQNAALVYKQAIKSLRLSRSEKWAFDTLPKRRTPQMRRDIETAVQNNQKALDLARRAAAMPQCRFPLDYITDNPVALLFPHYGGLQELARLLAAEALSEAQNGEKAAALRDVRAMFGMSHHLSKEPFLIGFLVSQEVEALSHQVLAQVMESVPFSLSEARALQKFLPVNDVTAAFRYGLMAERTVTLSIFDRLTRHTITGEDLTLFARDSPSSLWSSAPFLVLWRPVTKLDEVQSLHLWKQAIDWASTAPFQKGAKNSSFIDQELGKLPHYAVMTRVLMPAFSRARNNRDFSEVRRRQREIALSLAVYRTAKGKYPAHLSEIVDVSEKPLPLDPYSRKPFVYRVNEKSFLLYSVGVNQVDNGGKSQGFGANLNVNNDDILWGGTRY